MSITSPIEVFNADPGTPQENHLLGWISAQMLREPRAVPPGVVGQLDLEKHGERVQYAI